MKRFYQYNSVKQIPISQLKSFERSYASYEKYYNKLKNPQEAKLTKEEYLQEYKSLRNDFEDLKLDTKALPRSIAKEQTYQRSIYQDINQLRSLKEEVRVEKYEKMTLSKFRRLNSEDIKKDLFDMIQQDRVDFLAMSNEERMALAGTTDVNYFISKYYFGSE